MKTNLLFCFILLGQILSAQTFTEVMGTPFDGVSESSIAFVDVDGDNDQDVVIVGINYLIGQVSRLYTNDGQGNFSQVPGTPFQGVSVNYIAFANVDEDNDEDAVITGHHSIEGRVSRLFTNDGDGNFTGILSTPMKGVFDSAIAFSDVDGDNDQDMLITGGAIINGMYIPISKLYINGGQGNFTEAINTPFHDVESGSIAFADVDGDNDQDVVITGWDGFVSITKLYINDGIGNFTEMTGTTFDGVYASSIAFSDVDGDNDQDLFITGVAEISGVYTAISKLYVNDGLGNFAEVIDTPFEGVAFGSIAFSDVDGDNDQDLLITGGNNLYTAISKLYTNDGTGNFTEVIDTPFDDVVYSAIAFSDIDSDNDQDLLITGVNNSNIQIAKLYINESVVSIENIVSELSFEFKLYPNPTKTNTINVSYDSKESTWVDVNIFDLKGRLLKQHQERIGVGEHTFSMNISPLSKGAYTVQLNDGVRVGSQKFIVK